MTDLTSGATGRNWWSIGLWVVQVLLAFFFGFAGFTKLTTPVDQLVTMMAWASATPTWLIYFIGAAEVLGAIGIILPAATRILPFLTPLAALGFAVIQVLAIGLHLVRGEAMVLPLNIVVLALSLLVVWGRTRKAPIAPR